MNNFLVRIIKWGVGISILVFMILYFIKNFSQVPWEELRFKPLFLAGSIVVLFIDHLFFAKGWNMIIKGLGNDLSFIKAARIFFISLLGRYVPGKALLVVSRMYLAHKEGISKRTTFSSIVIEIALVSVSAFICFIVSLLILKELPLWIIIISIILIPVILILLMPPIFLRLIGILFKIIKKRNIEIYLSYAQIIKILFLYIIKWILAGIAMFLLLRSMMDIPLVLLFIMPGIIGVSTIVGMVALISPGGLGFREGLMVLLLSYFIPFNFAIIFSLISRVVYVAMEFLMVILFQIINGKKLMRFFSQYN